MLLKKAYSQISLNLDYRKSHDARPTLEKRSSVQLQQLFRRLDVNQDGELDLSEFQKVVNKLGMDNFLANNDILVTRAFEHADKDRSGQLNMQDFERAYTFLYNYIITSPQGAEMTQEAEDYICCGVRYGKVIFYSICCDQLTRI